MGTDIKVHGQTVSLGDDAINRFISKRVITEEGLAKIRGIIKTAIKALLKGENVINNDEANILASYVLTYIENMYLYRYARYLKMRDSAEAEALAVEKSETIEYLRDLTSSIEKYNSRDKLPTLLLYVITHDYTMFR